MRIRLALIVLLIPTAAMAQANPGPFGGLFGRAPSTDGQQHTTLQIRATVSGQYDSTIFPPEELPPPIDLPVLLDDGTPAAVDSGSGFPPVNASRRTQSGMGSGATVGVMFEHASESYTAGARGGATRQQFFTEPAYGVQQYYANAEATTKVGSRLELKASAGYLHSPYYSFFNSFGQSSNVTLNDAPLTFSPYAVAMAENESVEGAAGLTYQTTRNSHFNASVYRRQTNFAQQTDADYLLNGYRVGWSLQLSRDLGVHTGYSHERIDQGGAVGGGYDHDVIDAGIDFTKSLSLSRRTTLGITTSTSMFKDSSSNSRIRVNGLVSVQKFFRRTWRVAAEASRQTEFLPGFVEPLLTDTVGAFLSGMFSRRIDWMAGVSGGHGNYGFSDTTGFGTVAATTQLNYALTHHLSAYAQYVSFWYEVPARTTSLRLPGQMNRQVASVGVSAYIPVYQKMRAPRDTR